MSSRAFNIAIFNTQCSWKENLRKVSITTDAEKNNIQVTDLTETHIKESTVEQARGKKKNHTVYHNGIEGTNKYTVVGILIEEEIPGTFTRVNDRICYAEIQLDKYKVILIVAYTSTLIISERNPVIRKDFYDSLSEVTKRINKSRHMMTTIGDFKAKTGTGKKEFLQNISKYGKSRLSTNSRCLLIILSVIEPLGLPLIE